MIINDPDESVYQYVYYFCYDIDMNLWNLAQQFLETKLDGMWHAPPALFNIYREPGMMCRRQI